MSDRPALDDLRTEAHVWLSAPEDLLPSERRRAALAVLSDEERAQHDRFRVEHARELYLAAHALARSVLSRYLEVDPAAWQFRFNRWGRPEIDGPEGLPRLRFNLSHTRGLVACIVALESDLGVDVEAIERHIDLLGVARHSFAPAEVEELRSLPLSARRLRFFSFWTLKESYIKARGMGMALPLKRFAFSLAEPGALRVRFDATLEDRVSDWQFHLYRVSADHLLAAGLRHGGGVPRRIRTWRTIPLAGATAREDPEKIAATADVARGVA